MKHIIWFLILFISPYFSICQNTVGLVSYNKSKSHDGYTLIFPHNQSNVYLINTCGEIVHSWPDSTIWRPGNTAYITKEGKLIKAKRDRIVVGNPIWFGGGGAIVEIRDWNNNLEWSYEINDSTKRMHHDISIMPNGNILILVWNKKTQTELIAAGRDTSKFKNDVLHSEIILEVNPKTNTIVWQWDLWDHIIQDYDATKPNFGVVSQHPEKIDINFPWIQDGSWFHINAIDYNAELDQIIVSVPTYNEFWILDHTTTTQQAKGSTGGFGGAGGDLIYRWGNAATYKKGSTSDQKSFYQHGVHWATSFLPPTYPDYGKIVFFNNRAGNDFSQVNLISPPWDMYEWKYTKTNGIWGPTNYDKTIKHPIPTKLYSDILSNAQLLPNGNTLILAGRSGYILELTPDNQIVWEYIVPLKNGISANQGEILSINDNTNFRANRYPLNYEGFQGKDLSPKGFIEKSPNAGYCNKLVSTFDSDKFQEIDIYPNPSREKVRIRVNKALDLEIISLDGKIQRKIQLHEGLNEINISELENGIYLFQSSNGYVKSFIKI